MSIDSWINKASDKYQSEFRKAIHIILWSIANSAYNNNLVLKGSILISIEHNSERKTKDIDFSTSKTKEEFNISEFIHTLSNYILLSNEELSYDIHCKLQSHKIKPSNEESTWPTLKIKVGYANTNKKNEINQLRRGKSSKAVSIDCSLNEKVINVDLYDIGNSKQISVYSLNDIISEKIRALIQQKERFKGTDYFRKQDVYDLYVLLNKYDILNKHEILSSLLIKSSARNMSIDKNTLDDEDIISKSKKGYDELQHEITVKLPPFEEAYNLIN
ncbi:MAG: nucleotidyl transferase AbiEii/AbiGii toxin family protein, partial [archaeon]